MLSVHIINICEILSIVCVYLVSTPQLKKQSFCCSWQAVAEAFAQYASVCLSICLSIYLVCLSVCLSATSVCLSVSNSSRFCFSNVVSSLLISRKATNNSLPICLSSVYLSVSILSASICLSVCLSIARTSVSFFCCGPVFSRAPNWTSYNKHTMHNILHITTHAYTTWFS